MSAYYNEYDSKAAAWLRELIKQGHIADGDVDERSIEDVTPNELKKYTQCHFFAGIGVWSYALRRAGWLDDRPVWTGSCPCQPFSSAGKAGGFDDERHLWPAFHYLIEQCQPDTVFGEQVASKDGLAWLDLVQADLEGTGYATGAVDLCAAGVGSPHIRQRLWFVAERMANPRHRECGGRDTLGNPVQEYDGQKRTHQKSCERRQDESGKRSIDDVADGSAEYIVSDNRLADTKCDGSHRTSRNETEQGSDGKKDRVSLGSSEGLCGTTAMPTNGFWGEVDWLFCRDGKWRPVEPGTFPLADGASERVGRLRGYGNAINAEAAEEIIRGYTFADEMKDILL